MPKISKIKPFFIDERGEMLHLINNNVTINSALLITCKKGSIRANHYHKKDNHYSYLIKGKMEYFCKTLKGTNVRKFIVNEGEMIFTPRNEIHAMRFLEESVFIALATEKRQKSKYEADTIRTKII